MIPNSIVFNIVLLLLSCPTFGYMSECEGAPMERPNLEKTMCVFRWCCTCSSSQLCQIHFLIVIQLAFVFAYNQPKSHAKPIQKQYCIRCHFRYRCVLILEAFGRQSDVQKQRQMYQTRNLYCFQNFVSK